MFHSSMQLLESGAVRRVRPGCMWRATPKATATSTPTASDRMVMEALRWKQAFARTHRCQDGDRHAVLLRGRARDRLGRTGLAAEGHRLPIHIGVAGPAKLQTLIKFAIACGVGPSLRVLQKRAMDVTKLLCPMSRPNS
jgi:methylenetetrahydrofolate reductase (NADPH)